MHKCEILADSINPQGDRLITYKITFGRPWLPEFNTHRTLSRNSASSRAVPFKKRVKEILENPFIPLAWQFKHKGMQGTKYLPMDHKMDLDECQKLIEDFVINLFNTSMEELESDSEELNIDEAREILLSTISTLALAGDEENNITMRSVWLSCRNMCIAAATILHTMNVTKQLCNRLLEPFMWHTVIVTATHYDNFFNLRCPQYSSGESPIFKSRKDYKKWHDGQVKSALDELGMVHFALPNFYPSPNATDLDWLSINKSQADIHIQFIAEMMWDARNESTPKQLKAGEWHIPFGDNFDIEDYLYYLSEGGQTTEELKTNLIASGSYDEEEIKAFEEDSFYFIDYINSTGNYLWSEAYEVYLTRSMLGDYKKTFEDDKIKIATARCARISYETLGANPEINYAKDLKLHDRLASSGHWSPFEHCARAVSDEEYESYFSGSLDINYLSCANDEFDGYYHELDLEDNKEQHGWCRNFKGFIQYRHLVDNVSLC